MRADMPRTTGRGGPSRRRVLAAAAVVAAEVMTGAGCAPADVAGTSPANDGVVAAAAARTAADLLASYRATVRRHPSLRTRLSPLAARHATHVSAFAQTTTPRGRAGRVPGTPREAVGALRAAEAAARRRRVSAAIETGSGDLARALASAAACQSQHLTLLDEEGR